MTCTKYPNALLQSVYGGQDCQPHGVLPFTGFEIATLVVIAVVLIGTGILLRANTRDVAA